MTDPTLIDALLAAHEADESPPAGLAGTVSMQEAYALQVALLGRRRDAGAGHSGWKIGQTNKAMRIERGEDAPAPGYLLAAGAHAQGASVALDDGGAWFLEPELALVLDAPLVGPGVDAARVAAAVGAMHAAFELVRIPRGWSDRALQRAINSNQAGYVLGDALTVPAEREAVADLSFTVHRGDEEIACAHCAEVMDHPFDSTAWLANYLSDLGETLQAGQVILTGSFTALLPMSRGETWTATVADAGVRVQTCQAGNR